MLDAQLQQVLRQDAQLIDDAVDLGLLSQRDGLVRLRFRGADVAVGDGDASEQVGEAREMARAVRFHAVERLHQVTERCVLRPLVLLDPQPPAQRVHEHIDQCTVTKSAGAETRGAWAIASD